MRRILRLLSLACLGFLAALVIVGAREAEQTGQDSPYTNDPLIRNPKLQVKLDDLNLDNQSVRYSLQPVDVEGIIGTTTMSTIEHPSIHLVITADTEHSAAEYPDWSETTISFPVYPSVKMPSGSTANIRTDGYQTRLPIRHRAPYWYPCDEIEISVTTSLMATDVLLPPHAILSSYGHQTVEATFPAWHMEKPIFDVRRHYSLTPTSMLLQEEDPGNVFIQLSRPKMQRLSTLILMSCLVAFTLTPWLIEIGDSQWEVVAAMIFGLWGTHQILVPPEVTWPTAIDTTFLGLYVIILAFVILTTLSRFLARPSTLTAESSEPATTIPPAAQVNSQEKQSREILLVLVTMGILIILGRLAKERKK
ncbi:MAG: hypothetical protein ACE5JU_23265 [Candidatus Binatia bacterium]